jgi:diguanylate cyclase (GGDEF)-like protein/PAS domain S-box-containing protein
MNSHPVVLYRSVPRYGADLRRHGRARAILEAIGDAVITTDTLLAVTYLNPAAERLTGWSLQEARGQPLDEVMGLVSEVSREPVMNPARRCLSEGRSIDLEEEVVLIRRDGSEVPIGDSTAPIIDPDGNVNGVVLVLQDEREKRRVGRQLSYEASHDALTGLVNRREFERRLLRVLSDLAVADDHHALIYLDLDGFKAVNDSCGHAAGDDLLRGLGPVLGRHLRRRDTLARIGGDEFAVLLEKCPEPQALWIAEGIRAAVEDHRFDCSGGAFSIQVSVGLITVTLMDEGVAGVLSMADAACYAAKEAGGNCVRRAGITLPAPSADAPREARASRRWPRGAARPR